MPWHTDFQTFKVIFIERNAGPYIIKRINLNLLSYGGKSVTLSDVQIFMYTYDMCLGRVVFVLVIKV